MSSSSTSLSPDPSNRTLFSPSEYTSSEIFWFNCTILPQYRAFWFTIILITRPYPRAEFGALREATHFGDCFENKFFERGDTHCHIAKIYVCIHLHTTSIISTTSRCSPLLTPRPLTPHPLTQASSYFHQRPLPTCRSIAITSVVQIQIICESRHSQSW